MSIGRVPGVTGIQPSIVDAKGDLIVATAADSVDRLAVGTNNTVLTADSATATGLKWAAIPASTPTFAGCALTQSGAQTISNTTETNLTFDTESFDTDGYHSTSTNTDRITIPTGKGGYYLIIARVGFASNSSGARAMWLYRNNNTYLAFASSQPISTGDMTTVQFSHIANLNVGDFITARAYQGSGGNLNTTTDQGKTYFAVQYLGA